MQAFFFVYGYISFLECISNNGMASVTDSGYCLPIIPMASMQASLTHVVPKSAFSEIVTLMLDEAEKCSSAEIGSAKENVVIPSMFWCKASSKKSETWIIIYDTDNSIVCRHLISSVKLGMFYKNIPHQSISDQEISVPFKY